MKIRMTAGRKKRIEAFFLERGAITPLSGGKDDLARQSSVLLDDARANASVEWRPRLGDREEYLYNTVTGSYILSVVEGALDPRCRCAAAELDDDDRRVITELVLSEARRQGYKDV